MKWFFVRASQTIALAAALLPGCNAQYLPTVVSVAPTTPLPSSSSAQNILLHATVTATSTVNSGTVWFTVLGMRVPAQVTNGLASAMFTVAGEMPAGSYPVTAAYVPDDSIYITNFSKSTNIWAQLNQQFPNTGAGTPGSPDGVLNATFWYNPAAYTSPNSVGFANVVTNSATFLIASDAMGRDVEAIGYTALTAPASVNEATAVHLLTASYGGTSYSVTFSGTGGASETFSAIPVGAYCNNGSVMNTANMQNGSASNNVFDQTVLEVRDAGACGTGNTANGYNTSYYLYEQTFLLNSSFANQTLTEIALANNNGGSGILLLGVTAESAAGPFFTSSSDNTGQLVIGQASQTVTWANTTASNAGPIPFSGASQNVTVSATVTAATMVNDGNVAFTLLGSTVTAPVTDGSASASMSVPGGTSPGSYPITATYEPANGGSSTTYYLTNFPKDNNIYTNLNRQYPNTGPGTPGSGAGTANAGYLYNPATYTSPAFVAGSDQATNGDSFLISSDNNGHDFLQISNNPPTLLTNIAQATAVHLLTGSYSGTAYDLTLTGDGGATELFSNITVPDFCQGGGYQINSNSMQNGSSTNNVFDQSVLYLFRDNGACATGNSATGDYTGYLLYEQTFLLNSSFASQNLSSISIGSDNTNNALLLLGVSVDGMFSSSTDSGHNLVVAQGTPVITWPNPADIAGGTPLGAAQLDATANVPGSFAYNPPSGTVLAAGTHQALVVTFTPTDTLEYASETATAYINVTSSGTVTTAGSVGTTVYSPNSQSITLTATVTSASAVTGGTVSFKLLGTTVSAPVMNGSASTSFTVPAGTAAGAYTIQATYNPATGFTGSSDSAHQLTIGKATPVIGWATPAAITAGAALGSSQLDASSNVAGSLVYNPRTGAVLPVGVHQALVVTFTPTDGTDYITATDTVYINVNNAATVTTVTPSSWTQHFSLTWQNISAPVVATVSSSSTVNSGTVTFSALAPSPTLGGGKTSCTVPVTNGSASVLLSCAIPGGLAAGTYNVQATYNPTTGYSGSSGSTQLVILKDAPTVTWASPASIAFGAALSAVQLDATASVPGSFTYNPPAGTVLPAGAGQTLMATFTPANSTDYAPVTTSVTIAVTAPAVDLVVSFIGTGATDCSGTCPGPYFAAPDWWFTNQGTLPLQNIQITSAKLTTASGTSSGIVVANCTSPGCPVLPLTVGNIQPGGQIGLGVTQPSIWFLVSQASNGTTGVVTISGTYKGGSFTFTSRWVIPPPPIS